MRRQCAHPEQPQAPARVIDRCRVGAPGPGTVSFVSAAASLCRHAPLARLDLDSEFASTARATMCHSMAPCIPRTHQGLGTQDLGSRLARCAPVRRISRALLHSNAACRSLTILSCCCCCCRSLVAQGAVGDERLLNELASACGYVACATAGAYLTATRGEAVSDLDRILGTAAGAPSTERHSFIVKCQYCDAPLKPFSPTDATLESYEAPGCTGSLQSFEPFLALYRHENAAIRAAFVAKSLPRILRHMTPTDARTNSDALTALLEVLRDPEADVREAASCSIWVRYGHSSKMIVLSLTHSLLPIDRHRSLRVRHWVQSFAMEQHRCLPSCMACCMTKNRSKPCRSRRRHSRPSVA